MRNSKLTDPQRKGRPKEADPARWNETYDEVDVELCLPHPSMERMRFDYGCEALEKNIGENGQLEPCRAVRSDEDGVHLLVYIGQRRLHAVKKLKTKLGSPYTLKVIIDEDDLNEEELIKRALAENIEEKGQRLPLSDIEKVSYCKSLLSTYDEHSTERLLTNAGFDRSTARKILFLVDKFDNQRLERLHKIEAKSNFRFKIVHLDLLLSCEDEENLYETASLAAFSQKPPEEIKLLRPGAKHFSKDIPWFGEIFPELLSQDPSDGELVQESEKTSEAQDREAKSRRQEKETDLGALPEPFILIPCHHCESINPFRLRTGLPVFIFSNLRKDGSMEQLAIEANAIFDCERECSSCGKAFWITASVLEGGKMVVETANSKMLETPRREAFVRKLYWDGRQGDWMLYDEISKKKTKLESSDFD